MNWQKLKRHKALTIMIGLAFIFLLVFLSWHSKIERQKDYANGAIQEYARMQKVPAAKRRQLQVSWAMKSDGWEAETEIKFTGKPYLLDYWIARPDVKKQKPEILFSVFKKEGEGWGEIIGKKLRHFKYQPLYNYQQ